MKDIKHGEINELEAVHKRCSYIASCPVGDYCIELVEAPLSGIFRQGYLNEHATCSDRQSTLHDTYSPYSNVQFTLPNKRSQKKQTQTQQRLSSSMQAIESFTNM